MRELFLADGKLVTEVAQVRPAAWLSTHGHGGRISERAAAYHGAYRERRQSARPLHRVEGLAVIEATPDGAQRVIATSAISRPDRLRHRGAAQRVGDASDGIANAPARLWYRWTEREVAQSAYYGYDSLILGQMQLSYKRPSTFEKTGTSTYST